MRSRPVFFALLLALLVVAVSTVSAQGVRVVASTPWTAAYAQAAGADEVTVIAPVELRHPPEYEIKPSDLEKVRGAALVVHAGYEKFAEKLAETAGGDEIEVLQVYTDNPPEVVKEQARLIADAIGTMPSYEQWAQEFDALAAEVQAEVQAAYPKRKAVVHAFQRTYAEWLGFEVVGEFGPAEPSPAVIADLVRLQPVVVIDNYHNPVGQAIAESAGAGYAQLINFPGKEGTATIEDVYRYNADALTAQAQQPVKGERSPLVLYGGGAAGVALIGGLWWFFRRKD